MSEPVAVALILDWENQRVVAAEFHTGPKAVSDCEAAIAATHDDYPRPDYFKMTLWNEAARPYAALRKLKELGLTEGQSDEELLNMLKEKL